MADLKISQLSSATALTGTEVVPVVQGGSTKKATIDQILAPASGKGIDFSAAGGDILKMYDEGTWTPTDASGAGLTLTVTAASYTRIGRMVYADLNITYPTTVDGSTLFIGGLPFISKNSGTVAIAYTNETTCVRGATGAADDAFFVLYDATGTALTNAAMSGDTLRATVIYRTA